MERHLLLSKVSIRINLRLLQHKILNTILYSKKLLFIFKNIYPLFLQIGAALL